MPTIETIYLGGLRTEATHVRSGNKLITDAPVDNHGKGEAFSPTDLLATSLGSCMITIVALAGETHGFDVTGTKLNINKIMAENPRRVAEVVIELFFPPNNFTEKQKAIIENTAKTCPVALSLSNDVKQTIVFNF